MTPTVEQARRIARQVVSDHRREERKMPEALARAAQSLGCTARRIKALVYGEPVALLADDWAALQGRWAAHLEAQERRLLAQAELMALRRRAIDQERAA